MSQTLVPIVCIGLAVYGWVALFCRSLAEQGYTMPCWQRYLFVAVLIVAILLSILNPESAPNPFVQAK